MPSDRIKRVDDLIDDLIFAAGWGAIVFIAGVIGYVVFLAVFGGAS